MSIAKLRKNRGQASEALQGFINSQQKKSYEDDTVWKPFLDKKTGIGQAVIRFLPQPDGEELPIVKVLDFGFKGSNGKWCIDNSPSTIGLPCPVKMLNSRLYERGTEEDKDFVSKNTKIRTNYFANIKVISDPTRPENEGKVFRYRFGPTVYGIIESAMAPKFEDDKPINPFDMWDGADLKLRVVRKGGSSSPKWEYDETKWAEPSEIGTDKEKEEIWKQCHSLKAKLDPSEFKSFQALQTKLIETLGQNVLGIPVVEGAATSAAASEYKAPQAVTQPAEANQPVASTVSDATSVPQDAVDSSPAPTTEQDAAAFFQNLANQSS